MNIDLISWKILNAVQHDGRISLKAISAEIGLSLPATSERLKRLEETGIISGYRAIIPPQKMGYNLTALINIRSPKQDKAAVIDLISDMPDIIECLYLAGDFSYQLKVVATDTENLEAIIRNVEQLGDISTSLVLSQPVPMRPAQQPTSGLYAVK